MIDIPKPNGNSPHWLDDLFKDELPQDPYEAFDVEDFEAFIGDRKAHRTARTAGRPRRGPVMERAEIVASLTDLDDTLETGFVDQTTYRPGEVEQGWLLPALGPFFNSGLITDISRMVKGGKEACVYQCVAQEGLGVPFVAAKVYRPRRFRNLRNDAMYRQGRQLLDSEGKELRGSRADRAIRKGTKVGKAMKHSSWLSHEYDTLEKLYAAGADVPAPIAMGDNCILMEMVGDDLRAAPPLSDTRITKEDAPALFERLVWNIELMLSLQFVHGDLSAYNVLYWDGEPTLIDFPQTVDAYDNPNARKIFQRDVTRICEYFTKSGLNEDSTRLASSLWQRHVRTDAWSRPHPGHTESFEEFRDNSNR